MILWWDPFEPQFVSIEQIFQKDVLQDLSIDINLKRKCSRIHTVFPFIKAVLKATIKCEGEGFLKNHPDLQVMEFLGSLTLNIHITLMINTFFQKRKV